MSEELSKSIRLKNFGRGNLGVIIDHPWFASSEATNPACGMTNPDMYWGYGLKISTDAIAVEC